MPYCITGLDIPDDDAIARVFAAFADFCVGYREALHTKDCLRLLFDLLEKYVPFICTFPWAGNYFLPCPLSVHSPIRSLSVSFEVLHRSSHLLTSALMRTYAIRAMLLPWLVLVI